MQTIEDHSFTGQDLSGKSFRFYTFKRCDFTRADLTNTDMTGALFHDCVFCYTVVERTKAAGTRWAKGGNTRLSNCVWNSTEQDDIPHAPEELAYAKANALLIPGTDRLKGQDFSWRYTDEKGEPIIDESYLEWERQRGESILRYREAIIAAMYLPREKRIKAKKAASDELMFMVLDGPVIENVTFACFQKEALKGEKRKNRKIKK